MSFPNDDFMSFMGYRNMVVEDKIEECLEAARRGETSVSIDRGNLTDEEAAYLQRELQRRLGGRG
jgi:hypothetical protein